MDLIARTAGPPTRAGRRRRGRSARVLLAAMALVLGASACTPAQFQEWWVRRGNPPMAEPQLSRFAALATVVWEAKVPGLNWKPTIAEIDPGLAARMAPSWRPGCPVPLSDLRYLRVQHIGFDGLIYVGEVVVHRDVANAVVGAFRHMFIKGFPIQTMQLVDNFGGDDDASMAANNTSAFNCREVTGRPGVFSQHSFGTAIDINPLQNPYVSGGTVLPPGAAAYLDRGNERQGMIVPGGPAVQAFDGIGWGWGGRWSSLRDYQHFSANGN